MPIRYEPAGGPSWLRLDFNSGRIASIAEAQRAECLQELRGPGPEVEGRRKFSVQLMSTEGVCGTMNCKLDPESPDICGRLQGLTRRVVGRVEKLNPSSL